MTNSITNFKNYIPSTHIDPFFEVNRVGLTADLNGDGVQTKILKDGIFSPNGALLGVVSNNYNMVTNREVAEIFDSYFQNMDIYSVRDMVNNTGSKWKRDYILNEDKYTVAIGGKKDEVKTKITIHNGYDGKTSVGLSISAWRLVCSNGMMGWKKMVGTKFSHFNKNIINILSNTIDNGFKNFSENFEIWDKWSREEFTENQFKGFIDQAEILSDKQKDKVKDLYRPIMIEYNEEETKWGAYNVITAIATHHTKARNENVAPEFSNSYSTMERLSKLFYKQNIN